ncbi:energy transducer TonB [Arenimonas fontis]|uniref:Energy transducer TonB n=1 Tax=Arenimonas fontis TaxID=2608255 RepID=A0A5B2Z7N0_9GAMM|nr:energy transducer TonB [Arenimonas fontis]KAA2283969.1 energy transducer TonB [Arenimonas fontis]
MVRNLAQPSPFAGLDGKRIAGTSLVIALHALAFGVLMTPSAWSPPERPIREMSVVPVELRPAALPRPPQPPPEQIPRRPVPRPSPGPAPVLAPVQTDPAPVFESGEILGEAGEEATPAADTYDPGPPQLAQLAYDVAPAPRYPRSSLRAGHEGTVWLRVLVDEHGQPQSVEIERSSGHRELDRAAREQVLNRWRFHPARHQGRAIAAYALVPIRFSLP